MEIEINYDRILETALQGVRRATVFLGLGFNAANDPQFKTYQLSKIATLTLVPDDVDPATLTHFKESFGHWIVGNGLRELMETFAIFLDQIYSATLHITV